MSATVRKSKPGDAFSAIEPPCQGRMTGIRIVKSHAIVAPSRKEVLDKLLNDMESELGRLSKLLQQTRAEFLRASD